jgi:hypothetical protein
VSVDAKPAGVNGGHREFQITAWKPYLKNIEFQNRAAANRFRDAALQALDRHLEGER